MTRILVFTPTYDDMLRPETVDSVKSQRFDGEIAHRFDDRNLHEGRSMLEVCEKYRDARIMALDGGYDALMCVEHDMILPPDCVQKLWDTAYPKTGRLAPVVYAAYMLRHGARVINLFRYEGDNNIGMSLSLYPRELKRARKREVIRVSGGGFGATLMRREALELVPFRVLDHNPPDMAFAGDCVRAGVVQMGRFDVACLHVDEGGNQLSIEDSNICRVEALQNVTVRDTYGSVEMKKGRYYPLHIEAAEEHARAGYVRIDDRSGVERETATAEDFETSEPPVVKRRKPRARKPKTMSTKNTAV